MNVIDTEWAATKTLPWADFFRALPSYLALKASFTTVRLAAGTVCSVYRGPSCWDVWIE